MGKIKSGICGLDELFGDGIPRGSNMLVFGRPGSGKTILALEFIYKGASLFNEPGVFVSFEQSEDNIVEQCERFGWNFKKYIKQGKIKIINPDIDEMDRDFANKITEAVYKTKAKRLVIDNLALLALSHSFSTENKKYNFVYKDKIKVAMNPRQMIYNLINILKDLPTTTLFITVPGEEFSVTSDGISEYICDGIIQLGIRSLGKSSLRTIEASKMRKSQIIGGIHSFKITQKGLKVEL